MGGVFELIIVIKQVDACIDERDICLQFHGRRVQQVGEQRQLMIVAFLDGVVVLVR